MSCSGRLRCTQVGKPSGNPVSVGSAGAPTLGKTNSTLRRLNPFKSFLFMLDTILVSGLAGGLIIFIILGSVQLAFFIKKLIKDVNFRKNFLLRFVRVRKYFLIILILILGVSGLLYWYEFQIAIPREESTRNMLRGQQQELEQARSEIDNLEKNKNNKPFCEDISLDRTAPSYTGGDLEAYIDELNSKGVTKDLSNADLKYLIDLYFASQWITIKPECKQYIESLVETRRLTGKQNDKQEKQLREMSETQNKLLQYNQCLTASDQSTCQFLLY